MWAAVAKWMPRRAPNQNSAASAEPTPAPSDDWVVITFLGQGKFAREVMKSLRRVEVAADRALRTAGAGQIDGNEVGQGEYQLYFVGSDREEMWRILRPVFEDSRARWSKVELSRGLDGDNATVIRQGE